jgi:hypothetical protein
VTVTLDATDPQIGTAEPSGVVSTEFRVGDGPWEPYTGQPTSFEAEGTVAVAGRSVDGAGNQEPARVSYVRIDQHPPATTATLQGRQGSDDWYHGPVWVFLDSTDALSGVDGLYWRLDHGAWQQASSRASVFVSGSADHVVDYYAVDLAGNVEPVESTEVPIDDEQPTIALVHAPADWGFPQYTVTANANDRVSGVAEVRFYLDGASAPSAADTDGSDGWSWNGTFDVGLHSVRAEAQDRSGLVSDASMLLLVIPQQLPLPAVGALAGGLALRRRRAA